MTELLFALAAYLMGSVPFAMISSRLFGLADPRSYGSGNPGATNVLRSGNKSAAVITLLGDAFKGWLAVWLAARFGPTAGVMPGIEAICGLAAFIGHLYPVFLRFKGGKGVATALGVLIGFSGWVALACALAWIAVAAASRYSSAAALSAAAAAPLATYALDGGSWQIAATIIMAILLAWRHLANIRRLLAGTESRIGGKKG
ncbi:MAG: glycerol-3-phosphate 1-O-acyltransferase PlsY [Rhodocyclaceae bacterium]|nr:glycerol-3-phosphate 1-O-acyltransferase PlsY [Rhodocyclaceae bacterium]